MASSWVLLWLLPGLVAAVAMMDNPSVPKPQLPMGYSLPPSNIHDNPQEFYLNPIPNELLDRPEEFGRSSPPKSSSFFGTPSPMSYSNYPSESIGKENFPLHDKMSEYHQLNDKDSISHTKFQNKVSSTGMGVPFFPRTDFSEKPRPKAKNLRKHKGPLKSTGFRKPVDPLSKSKDVHASWIKAYEKKRASNHELQLKFGKQTPEKKVSPLATLFSKKPTNGNSKDIKFVNKFSNQKSTGKLLKGKPPQGGKKNWLLLAKRMGGGSSLKNKNKAKISTKIQEFRNKLKLKHDAIREKVTSPRLFHESTNYEPSGSGNSGEGIDKLKQFVRGGGTIKRPKMVLAPGRNQKTFNSHLKKVESLAEKNRNSRRSRLFGTQKTPEKTPNKILDKTPNRILDKTPNRIPDKIPYKIPNIAQLEFDDDDD